MESRATGHRAHRKNLKLDPLAVKIGVRLVPIDLRLDAPLITLRNDRLVFGQTQNVFAPLHILPNRPLRRRASGNLSADPIIDPPRRMRGHYTKRQKSYGNGFRVSADTETLLYTESNVCPPGKKVVPNNRSANSSDHLVAAAPDSSAAQPPCNN